MVHYKGNELKHNYVFVSGYLNNDKYAVVVILSELLNDFKLRRPGIQFENATFRSDRTVQHTVPSLHFTTLSCMTNLKDPLAWDFSATSHGKGDIDDVAGTCKRHAREKTQACIMFPKKFFRAQ